MNSVASEQNKTEMSDIRKIMSQYSVMLLAPMTAGVLFHGIRVIISVIIGVLTCIVCGKAAGFILKTKFPTRDFSPFFLGACVALLLPATAPWWMIVYACVFSMIVCVVPFGAAQNAPFVPPAAAFCFVLLCHGESAFDYYESGSSLALLLSQGNSIGKNTASVLEALVGNVPAAAGTGCIIALFGALLFLVICRPKDSISSLTFLLAVCVMALIFPRVGTGRFISVVMELCSGAIFFSAVFFMSYPSILPKSPISRALWGAVSGIICMIIRYAGSFEESAIFGILIACAISGFFDKLPVKKGRNKFKDEKSAVAEPVSATVVPDSVLEKIPDAVESAEDANDESHEVLTAELESFEKIISEENNISPDSSPFIAGGDDGE